MSTYAAIGFWWGFTAALSLNIAVGATTATAGDQPHSEFPGVTYHVGYIGEVVSNLAGGISQGSIYQGRLAASAEIDLEKLWGLPGTKVHADAFQIHGEGITTTKVGNFNALSNIEATAATRLSELWVETKLLNDRLSVRAGQLAVDSEFVVADGSSTFISASFGWPTIAGVNLPSGGVAYPFAAPGMSAAYRVSDHLIVRAAVVGDNPARHCATDPQICNPYGLEFSFRNPPFAIAETQIDYAFNRLPGSIKLGKWVDFASFDDVHLDAFGRSLADPDAGAPRIHHRNYAVYGIIDQQLYSDAELSRSVSTFARVMAAPQDRNLVAFSVDAGVTFMGFCPGRPHDTMSIGASLAQVSDQASQLDRDARRFDAGRDVRDLEVVLEGNLMTQISPHLSLQPSIQYVWHPSGGASEDTGMTRIPNAVVVGFRSAIAY